MIKFPVVHPKSLPVFFSHAAQGQINSHNLLAVYYNSTYCNFKFTTHKNRTVTLVAFEFFNL